jgi:hypothetical protein
MSTNNRILVLIGLTLVGSLGWAARDNAGADEPPAPASGPALGALRTPPREQFLLLTDGQTLQGIVSEQESQYTLTQRAGVLKFPKSRVEGAFDSMLDVYQYKVQQLPERDSDERFKLARWCLKVKLKDQAREQLTRVCELNSLNKQAQAMLVSIDQESVRVAQRQRDPEVRQTRADSMTEDRPGTLDSAVINGAANALRINNLPVIFDLPQPLAIKRSQEFVRSVHQVLQLRCTKCHNGEYDGPYQLVPIKSRADRTPDAYRANLDATLRFIDPVNPSKSELLSSTLRPHGNGPNRRPIFPGSNDRAYQVLATWVNSLRPLKNDGDVARGAAGRSQVNQGETFASDRDRISRTPGDQAMPGSSASTDWPSFAVDNPKGAAIPPPSRPGVSRRSIPEDPNDARPQEFPIPFAVSQTKPALPKSKPAPKPSTNIGGDAPAKSAAPVDADKSPGQPSAKDESAAAKKPSKPQLKLDPELLQRVLQSRKANNPQP